VDADSRLAARERLAEELAGGRFLLLPRGRAPEPDGAQPARNPAAATAAPGDVESIEEPKEESPVSREEMAERLKQFRAKKVERAERDRAAAEAAARAEAAPPPRGGSARAEEGMFSGEHLTDESLAPADRLAAMEKLVAECELCEQLVAERNNTVFGDGPPDAELVFVGEAPGADEDAQGVPFVGRAGKLLDKIIAAMGMKRGEVYICNVLKCRPPNNRNPLPNEAANCWPFLREQLEVIKPKLICTLGAPATRRLMGTDESIGRMRGAVHDYFGTPLIATYHPAYLLRDPRQKGKVWDDMKMALKILGRPVPKQNRSVT
jgi:DNA polymerase